MAREQGKDSARAASVARPARVGAASVALSLVISGCLGSVGRYINKINYEESATGSLEGFIHDQLTAAFHRSVRSVHCTPYVDQVQHQSSVTLTCVIRFASGSGYQTEGTVTNTGNNFFGSAYTYSFDDPPGYDLTTAALPEPAVSLAATSPRSLFVAHNLAVALGTVTQRFGEGQLIIQAALYPGELQLVIGANGEARLVTVDSGGTLTSGETTEFDGSRNGIAFSQFEPKVIQHLVEQVARRDEVPQADIARFVLATSLPGGNAGWTIYPASGSRHFQAYVMGDGLRTIDASATRNR